MALYRTLSICPFPSRTSRLGSTFATSSAMKPVVEALGFIDVFFVAESNRLEREEHESKLVDPEISFGE